MTPQKAIRLKCLDCMCDQASEVKQCPSVSCPLYPFRFGKNPYVTKREYTEEQKRAMTERLRSAAQNKRKNTVGDGQNAS